MNDNITQRMNRNTIDTGKAKISHVANVISGAFGNNMVNIRANDKLGGVPTKVATPPIVAAWAIPKNIPIENFLIDFLQIILLIYKQLIEQLEPSSWLLLCWKSTLKEMPWQS